MLSLHNGLTVSASVVSVCSSLPFLCHLVSQLIAFHPHQLEEGGSLHSPTSSCTPQTHVSCRNTSPGKRGNKVTHQVKYWSCFVCSLVNIALMSSEETSIWCKFREEKRKRKRNPPENQSWDLLNSSWILLPQQATGPIAEEQKYSCSQAFPPSSFWSLAVFEN